METPEAHARQVLMETPHGDTSTASRLDPREVGVGRGAAARVLPEATHLTSRFQVLVRPRSLSRKPTDAHPRFSPALTRLRISSHALPPGSPRAGRRVPCGKARHPRREDDY